MSQLLLWSDADVAPKRTRRKVPRAAKLCPQCQKKVTPKLRSVMPLTHAVETVRGILIDRLDAALPDLERIAVMETMGHEIDAGVCLKIAIRFIQAAQVRLFPEEFADGEPYVPDPSARMDVPPVALGLVPRLPTVAIYAKHLLELGRQSPAANIVTPDGRPLFTDADLARLGERIERRQAG